MKLFLSRHKEPLSIFALALGLLGAGWLAAYLKLRDIAEPLILHWSEYTGINQIGSIFDLSLIALTEIVMWAVNLMFALALEARVPVLARVAALGTLFMAGLLFVAFMAIIAVNT